MRLTQVKGRERDFVGGNKQDFTSCCQIIYYYYLQRNPTPQHTPTLSPLPACLSTHCITGKCLLPALSSPSWGYAAAIHNDSHICRTKVVAGDGRQSHCCALSSASSPVRSTAVLCAVLTVDPFSSPRHDDNWARAIRGSVIFPKLTLNFASTSSSSLLVAIILIISVFFFFLLLFERPLCCTYVCCSTKSSRHPFLPSSYYIIIVVVVQSSSWSFSSWMKWRHSLTHSRKGADHVLLGHRSSQVENEAERGSQGGDKVQIPVGHHVLRQREDEIEVTLQWDKRRREREGLESEEGTGSQFSLLNWQFYLFYLVYLRI